MLRLLLFTLIAGCSGAPQVATFPENPHTTKAGDYCGKFEGTALDQNNAPVANAVVWATWTKTNGQLPAGFEEKLTSTDANGKYVIPKLKVCDHSVSDFVLYIYKKNHIAYRSDRLFPSFERRFDFYQRSNQAVMPGLNSGFSHKRHLEYLGSAPAIATNFEWEQALAESEGDDVEIAVPTGINRRIVASQLLSPKLIEDVLSYKGDYTAGPLGDQPDTDMYSTMHLQANNSDQSYDIAVRMWTFSNAQAARESFVGMVDSLPNAKEKKALPWGNVDGVIGDQGPVKAMGLVDYSRNIALILTCGNNLCKNESDLELITKETFKVLESLWPVK